MRIYFLQSAFKLFKHKILRAMPYRLRQRRRNAFTLPIFTPTRTARRTDRMLSQSHMFALTYQKYDIIPSCPCLFSAQDSDLIQMRHSFEKQRIFNQKSQPKRSRPMAKQTLKPTQQTGGTSPAQQQGQDSAPSQQQGQTVFRDWASI